MGWGGGKIRLGWIGRRGGGWLEVGVSRNKQLAPDATPSGDSQHTPFVSLGLHQLVQVQGDPLTIEGLTEGKGKYFPLSLLSLPITPSPAQLFWHSWMLWQGKGPDWAVKDYVLK